MNETKKWPSYYILLLTGFGISNLGNWIYLIALNVFVWRLTESPAAVAGIYIVGPVVRILCNLFVGSLIDRWNKKKIVVVADILRGVFVFCMPFVDSVFLIYSLVALTNIASTFFGPSSTYLISTLVRKEHRLRFNALNSTLSSGSFMIGPAIGGAIIAIAPISMAMWINSSSFFICAILLSLIPNQREEGRAESKVPAWQTLKSDYQMVYHYSIKKPIFSRFIIIYSIALMIAFSLDSQEMSFLLDELMISEGLYGVTVTIAGIGAVIGGVCATAFAKKIQVATYIKVGFSLTMLSYLVFYSANAYFVAIASFVALGFFMAFSNSGYATYYQETVDPQMMGRFSSIVNLFQAILQVSLTLILGILCEAISIQLVTVCFASCAFLISLFLWEIKNKVFMIA